MPQRLAAADWAPGIVHSSRLAKHRRPAGTLSAPGGAVIFFLRARQCPDNRAGQDLRTVALSITTVALGAVFCVCGSGVDPAFAIFFSTSMPPVIFPNGV